jgi:hypothetical protein
MLRRFVMSSPRSIATQLLSREPPPLCPSGVHDKSAKAAIVNLKATPLVTAALHLANDDIDGCHDIVGDMNGETAKVLHATLHRREGETVIETVLSCYRLPDQQDH